jgi:predicted DNA-binding transcriptional regulator YafY
MTPAPGRDQTGPMERLVRLIGALTQHPKGASLAVMLTALGSADHAPEARRRMLTRDIEQLNQLGYDVRNIADPGADGVYLMRARDNRLQVLLTPEQRGELLRAAIAAGLDHLGGHLGATGGATGGASAPSAAGTSAPSPDTASPTLDLVQRGTTRHCRVRFTYKGEPRVVHPAQVHSGPSGWYLRGREEGGEPSGLVKEFVVSRMSDVSLDRPGTAEVLDEVARPAMDPLSWRADPPTEVVLRVPAEHRVLVENLLGSAVDVREDAGELLMTYAVTNRSVFRWRVYELGTRVRVVSPDDVRAEMLAELQAVVDA